MPNHVINKVSLSGDATSIAKLKEYVKGEQPDDFFSFDRILPMPKELEGTTSPNPDIKQASHLKFKTGYTDWYQWCCNNWGTKWPAYDQNPEPEGDYEFQTAWSCPKPVFAELARIFPEIEITVRFADDDIGSNCGTLICHGDEVELVPPETQEAAKKFALDMWGRKAEDY